MLSRPSAPPPREGGWRSNGSFTKSPLEAQKLRFSLISINSTAVFGGGEDPMKIAIRNRPKLRFQTFPLISINFTVIFGGGRRSNENCIKNPPEAKISSFSFEFDQCHCYLWRGSNENGHPNLRFSTLPFCFRSIFTAFFAEGWWYKKY